MMLLSIISLPSSAGRQNAVRTEDDSFHDAVEPFWIAQGDVVR
jgi:hypothetical protein